MNTIRNLISKRKAINPEYDYGRDLCWKEEINYLINNINESINFISSEATDEEVYWLSEVLCDIYDKTQDIRFIQIFKERAEKMNNKEMQRSIIQEINHV